MVSALQMEYVNVSQDSKERTVQRRSANSTVPEMEFVIRFQDSANVTKDFSEKLAR